MILINYSSSWNPGTQANQTLLGNLQPLTPEITEDVEDLQAVESITAHGSFSSGNVSIIISVSDNIFSYNVSK